MLDHNWQSSSLSGSLVWTSNEAIPRAEPREPTPYMSLYKPEAFYPESRPRAVPTAFQSSDNARVSLETGQGRAAFVPRCATNASALKVNSFYHPTMLRNSHAKRLALSSYPNSSLEYMQDLFQPKCK